MLSIGSAIGFQPVLKAEAGSRRTFPAFKNRGQSASTSAAACLYWGVRGSIQYGIPHYATPASAKPVNTNHPLVTGVHKPSERSLLCGSAIDTDTDELLGDCRMPAATM